jgi:hypothetical protein
MMSLRESEKLGKGQPLKRSRSADGRFNLELPGQIIDEMLEHSGRSSPLETGGIRQDDHMELRVFYLLGILEVDPVLECLEKLIGTSVLHAVHHVILGLRISDEHANVTTLQHRIKITGPWRAGKARCSDGFCRGRRILLSLHADALTKRENSQDKQSAKSAKPKNPQHTPLLGDLRWP